jgi:hypothetical protein
MQFTYFGSTDKEGYSSFWVELEVRHEEFGPFKYQASECFEEKDLEDEGLLSQVLHQCKSRCVEASCRWVHFQSLLKYERSKVDEAYRKLEEAIEQVLEEIEIPISFSFWQINFISLATCEYNLQSPEDVESLEYEGEACEYFKSKGYRDLMRVYQPHKVIQ